MGMPPASTPVPDRSGQRPRHVVAVGASAGGLEALQELLGGVTSLSRLTVVIAQHLAADHPSALSALLTKSSGHVVLEAVDEMALEPGQVVVIPPGRDGVVEDGRLRLLEPPDRSGPSPSIDRLLASLADSYGVDAIGVVLSGTGTDGADGLRRVRRAGGLTLVQSPASARFDGMPRAALGSADLVADPEEIGQRLSTLGTTEEPDAEEGVGVDDVPGRTDAITTCLRRVTGLDFTGYKASSLSRQVSRRMSLQRLGDVSDYVALLQRDDDEARALANSLLVTVTSFFRDGAAFSALRAQLATYVAALPAGAPIRAWVAGCASGEEAYSVAMSLSEVLGRPHDLARRIKVFASDLHEASLAVARRGWYPDSDAARIPADLRERYTVATEGGRRFTEALRECIVFARHDITRDPPFPSMDLITCRNTLIYFTKPTQERVITSFEFALKPGGLLFLGAVEGIDRTARQFTALDADNRIYVRRPGSPSRPWQTTTWPAARAPSLPPVTVASPIDSPPGPEHEVDLLEGLVRLSGDAHLVFDDRHSLVRVVGDAGPFCAIPEGRIASAGGSFLRPELQEEARALFLLSRADGQPVTGHAIPLADLGQAVRLRATPLHAGTEDYTVLTIAREEAPVVPASGTTRSATFDREITRLERELLDSQESLRRSVADLQAMNEELEASSEELQASSEELQSSNEEVQATNEELQATNEELVSLNQELRERSDELERLNTDLENIQGSMNQGMVIVDRELRVLRYSPLAVRLFALVKGDIGHDILGVPTTAPVVGLEDALHAVLDGEDRQVIECVGDQGTFLVQVLPNRDRAEACIGAIITMTDITEMVQLRTAAAAAYDRLRSKSEQLETQAATDALTGLLNRRAFTSALSRAVERKDRATGSLAVFMIDLDRFKEVNDESGHEAGDLVLQLTAQRILDAVRASDVVARLGGDEFGVVIEDYDHDAELDDIVDRLLAALGEPAQFGDRQVSQSASIGVAIHPKDDVSVDGLLRAADAAMYSVKREGGGRSSYFDRSMNEAAEGRRRLRRELQAGIAEGEFELHYQPIIDASSRECWGVEALLRWRKGEEIVPAAHFIPFCEESGLIRPLGRLSARLLAEDRRALAAAGHQRLQVCFNVSVHQLEDRDFRDSGEDWPGDLDGLVVEVLESVFLPDHPVALDHVNRLRENGGAVAIDDYGSGFSNLRLLEALAPSYLKLDRSLLAVGGGEARRAAMIRSAVDVARVVGSAVIAEGVETEDEFAAVVGQGVGLVQGYFVARPMPLPALLEWLADPS